MIPSSLIEMVSGCGARSVGQLADCSGQGLNPELAYLPHIFQQ